MCKQKTSLEKVEEFHVGGEVGRLVGALLPVLGETLVLVVGRALLVVDHVADRPVHR